MIEQFFNDNPWVIAVICLALIAVIIVICVLSSKRKTKRRLLNSQADGDIDVHSEPAEHDEELPKEGEKQSFEEISGEESERISGEINEEEKEAETETGESLEKAENAAGQELGLSAKEEKQAEAASATAVNSEEKAETELGKKQEEPLPAGATVRTTESDGWYVRTLYNRSFMAKLVQSDDIVKEYYSVLKNELFAYGAKSRISWKHESFRVGRNTKAKFVIRGKTLCLCFDLNPEDYAESKYIVDDMSRFVSFAKTPTLYRIKNKRRLKYALELISKLFEGETRMEMEAENFADIPYRDTSALVEEGLVKIVRTERVQLEKNQVPVSEVDVEDEEDMGFEDDIEEMEEVEASEVGGLMEDDLAKVFIGEGSKISDKTKQCIVNVDTLGKYFEEGETVDLAALKERVPYIDKKATYVKVLARGLLSKALVVIADDYSLEAVKMIVLTGGRAIRNKRK